MGDGRSILSIINNALKLHETRLSNAVEPYMGKNVLRESTFGDETLDVSQDTGEKRDNTSHISNNIGKDVDQSEMVNTETLNDQNSQDISRKTKTFDLTNKSVGVYNPPSTFAFHKPINHGLEVYLLENTDQKKDQTDGTMDTIEALHNQIITIGKEKHRGFQNISTDEYLQMDTAKRKNYKHDFRQVFFPAHKHLSQYAILPIKSHTNMMSLPNAAAGIQKIINGYQNIDHRHIEEIFPHKRRKVVRYGELYPTADSSQTGRFIRKPSNNSVVFNDDKSNNNIDITEVNRSTMHQLANNMQRGTHWNLTYPDVSMQTMETDFIHTKSEYNNHNNKLGDRVNEVNKYLEDYEDSPEILTNRTEKLSFKVPSEKILQRNYGRTNVSLNQLPSEKSNTSMLSIRPSENTSQHKSYDDTVENDGNHATYKKHRTKTMHPHRKHTLKNKKKMLFKESINKNASNDAAVHNVAMTDLLISTMQHLEPNETQINGNKSKINFSECDGNKKQTYNINNRLSNNTETFSRSEKLKVDIDSDHATTTEFIDSVLANAQSKFISDMMSTREDIETRPVMFNVNQSIDPNRVVELRNTINKIDVKATTPPHENVSDGFNNGQSEKLNNSDEAKSYNYNNRTLVTNLNASKTTHSLTTENNRFKKIPKRNELLNYNSKPKVRGKKPISYYLNDDDPVLKGLYIGMGVDNISKRTVISRKPNSIPVTKHNSFQHEFVFSPVYRNVIQSSNRIRPLKKPIRQRKVNTANKVSKKYNSMDHAIIIPLKSYHKGKQLVPVNALKSEHNKLNTNILHSDARHGKATNPIRSMDHYSMPLTVYKINKQILHSDTRKPRVHYLYDVSNLNGKKSNKNPRHRIISVRNKMAYSSTNPEKNKTIMKMKGNRNLINVPMNIRRANTSLTYYKRVNYRSPYIRRKHHKRKVTNGKPFARYSHDSSLDNLIEDLIMKKGVEINRNNYYGNENVDGSTERKLFLTPSNRHLKPFMRHSNSYSKPFVLSPSRRSKAFILPTSRHLKPFMRHSNIYSKPFVLSPRQTFEGVYITY